jgi:hypothetical protein
MEGQVGACHLKGVDGHREVIAESFKPGCKYLKSSQHVSALTGPQQAVRKLTDAGERTPPRHAVHARAWLTAATVRSWLLSGADDCVCFMLPSAASARAAPLCRLLQVSSHARKHANRCRSLPCHLKQSAAISKYIKAVPCSSAVPAS